MDIHRCRFVPYPPQAINALAFSHPSDTRKPCPSSQRLAIGRANGDIEIWNPGKRVWSQETIVRGGKDRSIEGLAWTQDLEDESDGDDGRKEAGRLRLFSIGFSSAVTEWDLARGIPLRHANGNFGALWCLAAQPRWTPQKDDHAQHDSTSTIRHDQYLAAGCEDGTIVLFSTEDGDLRYLKTMGKPPTKKPRTLSITWKDHNTIVAGYSDSHIRVYDIRSRRSIRNMSLGKSTTGSPETLVWAVKCLSNGTILSGDSAGDLKIWDGNNYSLVQRLHYHEADILDIATNENGSMIVTCGADRRTVAYKPVPAGNGNKSGRWAQLMHRRFHEHDVKALASFESQDLSFVVSGGLDTVPVVMPLRGWQKEYHRTLSHLPQSPQVSSAARVRLFITWWERQVNVWHLPPHVQLPETPEAADFQSQQHALLAQVLMKGEENITSAHISGDGRYLVVATVSQIKVFQLRLKRNVSDGRMSIRPKKLETLASLDRFGARLVAFSPDCHWLCSIRLNNEVVLVRIENTSDDPKALPQFNNHVVKLTRTGLKSSPIREDAGLGDYPDTIKNISFSSDSRLLAVGDLSGRIATWALTGIESSSNGLVNGIGNNHGSASPKSSTSSESDDDSFDDESTSPSIHGQRWRKNPAGANLPALDAPLLVMSFRPSTPNRKIDTAKAQIGSHPTRHTPHPHAQDLPIEEDRLIAMTAEHKLVEFRILQGVLSDWSRRNPASYLPQPFQQIRERTMGCFWDVSSVHERVWLYGSTWMFMLDLSQDLPSNKSTKENGQLGSQLEPQSPVQKKRKWDGSEAKHWRKKGSGAGGAVALSESYVAVGNASRKFRNPKQEDSKIITLEETPYAVTDEDDSALAQIRRDEERNGERQLTNGHVGDHINGAAIHAQEASPSLLTLKAKGPASFLSLKYRSILGVVPIGGTGDGLSETLSQQKDMMTALPSSLEVAVIERPVWDVDFPPRFDGGQDWET